MQLSNLSGRFFIFVMNYTGAQQIQKGIQYVLYFNVRKTRSLISSHIVGEITFSIVHGFFKRADHIKVIRLRLKLVTWRPELKISTLAKWLISPLVRVIIRICKKHLVLKTNSNINIYNKT